MGRMKDRQIQLDYYDGLALEILQDIGAIKYDYVEDIYYDTGEFVEQEIYGLTTKKFKELCPEDKDFKTFNQAVQKVFKSCCYKSSENE